MSELKQPTAQELLEQWRGLYEQFSRARPGTPDWYPIIDAVVGGLALDKLKQLTLAAAETQPSQAPSPKPVGE